MSANSVIIPPSKISVIDIYTDQIDQIVKSWRYSDFDKSKKIEQVRLWLSNFECSEIPYVFCFLNLIYLVDEVIKEELLQTVASKIVKDFHNDLKDIQILALENDHASSGSQFLYSLKKRLGVADVFNYENTSDLKNANHLVLIDDVIGSGKQASKRLKEWIEINPNCRYYSLIGFKQGIDYIKSSTGIAPFSALELYEDAKIFSVKSPLKHKRKCKAIAKKYGELLYGQFADDKRHPLGYDDSQLLVCFREDCPNNTLPIIWAGLNSELTSLESSPWHPLFERKYVPKPVKLSAASAPTDDERVVIVTQTRPLQPSDFFRGRDGKLEEVKRLLTGDAKLMLLNGMGGIGKTEFCRKLFHECINDRLPEVKKVGWLVFHESIEQTFFQQFTELSFQTDSPAEYLTQVVRYLDNQKGELLLFVDNANDLSEKDAALLSQLRCKVVLTSRRRSVERLQPIEIGKLGIGDCRILYRQHSEEYPYNADYNYGVTYAEDDSPDEDLDAIIVMADRHTLAIELLAKTQKSAAYTAREMRETLIKTGFSLTDISESITYIHTPESGEWDKAEQIFIEQFSKVLDISNIKNEKLRVLQLFSLLSPDTILPENVKNWFEIDDLDMVNALVSQGWVFRRGAGERSGVAFSMHPLITSVVRHKALPSFETAAPLAIGLAMALEYNDDDLFTNSLPHLSHSISLVEAINGGYDEYVDLINCIAVILNQMAEYDKALILLEKAKRVCITIEDTDPLVISTVYHNMATCYIRQGKTAAAKDLYKKSIDIREQIPDIEDFRLATSYDCLGGVYESLGDYKNALRLHKKGLKFRLSSLGKKHPVIAVSYNNLGYTYSSLGDYKQALKHYQKALSIQKTALDGNHPDIATTFNNLGRAYDYVDNPELAMEYFKKALAAGEAIFGLEHPDVLLTRDNIANSYVVNGEYKTAEKQYMEILEVRLRVLGDNHHDTATNYHNLGIVYGYLSQNDKALKFLNKALEIDIRLLGERHPEVATIHKSIANVYYKFENREEEAFEIYKQVLDIELEAFGEKHPYVAISYNNIAIWYADKRHYERAMQYYEKALKIQENSYGRKHVHTSSTLYNIGRVYEDTGELHKALGLFLEAHEIVTNTYGEDNPEIATMGDGIAHTYDELGDYINAEKWFKNSIRLYEKFYEDTNIQLAVAYYLYADLLERQDRFDEALQAFTRCYDIESAFMEFDHETVKKTYNRIAALKSKIN